MRSFVMAKAALSRLLLVRSGATEWDGAGRVQGATDLPLSPEGEAKVREALAGLGGVGLDRVICAPDEASRQTARLLAGAAGVGRAHVVHELGEMRLGLWEGLRYEDLEARYCRAGRLFLDDPCGVQAPEGEALVAYAERLVRALGKVLGKAKGGSSVGLVLRPIALGVVRCVLNGADISQMWAMVTERPDVEWYQIQRDDPRLAAPPRRPERPASAA